jgi:endonuclease G
MPTRPLKKSKTGNSRTTHTTSWYPSLTQIAIIALLGLGVYFLLVNTTWGQQAAQQAITWLNSWLETKTDTLVQTHTPTTTPSMSNSSRLLLQKGTQKNRVNHKSFILAYAEEHEQAEWVAYRLTIDQLKEVVQERSNSFRPDTSITTSSASLADYRGSGYDKGHLAPAQDMSFDVQSESESFLLSNMSPQVAAFNRGIWRELEEHVRDWTRANKEIYIATGPILTQKPLKKIGKHNSLTVPAAYYKVLLDNTPPEQKAIGFVIPNAKSTDRIDTYAMSVDEVEKITNIDFFSELPDDIEQKIESQFNTARWAYDEEKFKTRLRLWNNLADSTH